MNVQPESPPFKMSIPSMLTQDDYNRLWSLITRKLSSEATAEELAELEELQKQIPGANNLLEVLTNWWQNDSPSAFLS